MLLPCCVNGRLHHLFVSDEPEMPCVMDKLISPNLQREVMREHCI